MRLPSHLSREAFQPEFGAYRGLARVSKSPSNPQNCSKRGNRGKGHFYFLRQTLACTKPWFKRDLNLPAFPSIRSVATRQGRKSKVNLRKAQMSITFWSFRSGLALTSSLTWARPQHVERTGQSAERRRGFLLYKLQRVLWRIFAAHVFPTRMRREMSSGVESTQRNRGPKS